MNVIIRNAQIHNHYSNKHTILAAIDTAAVAIAPSDPPPPPCIHASLSTQRSPSASRASSAPPPKTPTPFPPLPLETSTIARPSPAPSADVSAASPRSSPHPPAESHSPPRPRVVAHVAPSRPAPSPAATSRETPHVPKPPPTPPATPTMDDKPMRFYSSTEGRFLTSTEGRCIALHAEMPTGPFSRHRTAALRHTCPPNNWHSRPLRSATSLCFPANSTYLLRFALPRKYRGYRVQKTVARAAPCRHFFPRRYRCHNSRHFRQPQIQSIHQLSRGFFVWRQKQFRHLVTSLRQLRQFRGSFHQNGVVETLQ